MKKFISILLSLLLILSATLVSLAASSEAKEAAEKLNSMGLFNGTGTDSNGKPIFDLDKTLNRNEAVTMLVRLLGKEKEAKSGKWLIPFDDVTGDKVR